MNKLYNIPTNQQLVNIANSINNELDNIKKDGIYVVFELTKDLLRQVDEDYYFKNNKDSNPNDFTPSDEVEIIVLNVKFKFIERQDDNKENNGR